MTISPDGRRLAGTAFDTGIRVGRREQQAAPRPAPAPQPQRPALRKAAAPPGTPAPALPPNDKPRPVPPFQGQIKVWGLDKKHDRTIDGNVNGPSDLPFSPDRRLLAWGNSAIATVLDLE